MIGVNPTVDAIVPPVKYMTPAKSALRPILEVATYRTAFPADLTTPSGKYELFDSIEFVDVELTVGLSVLFTNINS